MKIPKIKNYRNNGQTRLLVLFGCIAALFAVLILRAGWHQLVKGKEYSQKALRQQTEDSVINALRGDILDSNGNILAKSASAFTVWVRPSDIKNNGKTDEEVVKNAKAESEAIAAILGADADDLCESLLSERTICRIAKGLNEETANILRAEDFIGIEIIEDSKRFYPLGSFASQIIGITSDDNVGLTGLERYYNDLLSGVNGRWIKSTDRNNNELAIGNSKYYDAENGFTLVTTIDINIQRVVEESIGNYQKEFDADRVFAIVMDPKTGDILAMAQSDDFDLNNPRTAKEGDEEYYSTLSESEQVSYWQKMWRNFCISDLYEPGSTFKPITAALALDYGVTDLKEKFFCSGSIEVYDRTIHCWGYPRSHGKETLADAVMNSCNPVMVQLVERIGKENFYNGLRTFCITEKTDVDFPGEGTNMIYDEDIAGPVELATMSFGQGIAVTPISLISAISSFANGGKLMQPRFVKEIMNSDGEVVETNEPKIKNITVSEETASDMLTILEQVVSEGGGGKAAISGYRIGGKTGTAYKAKDGGYSETEVFTSFVGVAPIEDPQFVCLVVFDTPKKDITATLTACPCAREIMEQILIQKNIEPSYTKAELEKMNKKNVEVPDLEGVTLEDAIGILAGANLDYEISSDPGIGYHEIAVVDQYPKAGSEIKKGSKVTIYYR